MHGGQRDSPDGIPKPERSVQHTRCARVGRGGCAVGDASSPSQVLQAMLSGEGNDGQGEIPGMAQSRDIQQGLTGTRIYPTNLMG